MLNSYTAIIFSAIVLFGALFLGVNGIGSDRIPDDVSVRMESASSGRRVIGGGIRHGK